MRRRQLLLLVASAFLAGVARAEEPVKVVPGKAPASVAPGDAFDVSKREMLEWIRERLQISPNVLSVRLHRLRLLYRESV